MATLTAIFGFPVLMVGVVMTIWAAVHGFRTTPSDEELTKLLKAEREAQDPWPPKSAEKRRRR